MKHSVYILFLIAFALSLALTSCFKDKDEGMDIVDVPISFNPAIQINSRAALTTSQYPEDTPFGVWAFQIDSKKPNYQILQGAQRFMTNSLVQYVKDEWLPEVETLWPANTPIAFFVYSPYSADAQFSKEKGIIFKDVDLLEDQTEYMFSDPISDCDREQSGGLVPVPFKRALSRVEFRMRSSVYQELNMKLKSLKIENVAHHGDFASLPYPYWTLHKGKTDAEFCTEEQPVNKLVSKVGVCNMIPQNLKTKVTVIVDIYDFRGFLIEKDKVLSANIQINWKPGQYVIYTLNIALDKVVFTTDILEQP